MKTRKQVSEASGIAVRRVADRLEPVAQQDFLDAAETLRDQIDVEHIAEMLAAHGAEAALALTMLAALPELLQPLVATLSRGFAQAGLITSEELSVALGVTVSFSRADPLAVAWARFESARLVTEVTNVTRSAMRTIIADAIEAGDAPLVMAQHIKLLIGLTERGARAVTAYRDELVADGLPVAEITARVAKYADELLTWRAATIARTEMIKAVNEGSLAAWQAAARDGYLDPKRTSRVWITTEDDRTCRICEPMDGQTVAFDAPFLTGDEEEIDAPPVHPGCRCAVGLSL